MINQYHKIMETMIIKIIKTPSRILFNKNSSKYNQVTERSINKQKTKGNSMMYIIQIHNQVNNLHRVIMLMKDSHHHGFINKNSNDSHNIHIDL